jgi:hypothetical protein
MVKNFKEISDAGLISFLTISKYKPLNKVSIQGRVAFQFERTDELEKACLDYYDKKTSVDALTLIETFFTVRQMVRELGR